MTRAASTESMGGVGASYERAAAATYLAAMLAGGSGPGLKGKVVRVAAQQPAALDDLEVQIEDGAGQTAIARLQVKHQLALTAAPSNLNFASIVADAWRDLTDPSFVIGFDRVGAVAEKISADAYYAANRLRELARFAPNGDALRGALDRPGQGGDAKAIWNVAEALSANALKRQPSNDELHLFWRHFVVVRIEATLEHDRDREHAVDQLRAVTYLPGVPAPASLFETLELIAGTLNVRGVGFDADQLLRHLAERHDVALDPVDPTLEPMTRTARAAAARDARAWQSDLKVAALPPEFQPLDPTAGGGDALANPIAAFKIDGIETYLRRHRGLAILGVPGAGKTQSLVQISQHLLETGELVPIVRSLPRLALGG
jgi:hypothetical protein